VYYHGVTKRNDALSTVSVERVKTGKRVTEDDQIVVEEPLEIRLVHGRDTARSGRCLAITMRTPGEDCELVAGFLFTEGILTDASQIRSIAPEGENAPGREHSNVVRVECDPDVTLDLERMQRHFFTTSSCGVCGKASLDALHVRGLMAPSANRPRITDEAIRRLPEELRAAQPLFASTGGIHAAGLVDKNGKLQAVREDIGRHNAVDKLIGRSFLDGFVPLGSASMVISGRPSFEILQKALVAGIGVVIAVGAPSSLAVDLARRFGMTLIGFTGSDRYNIYSGDRRIIADET
jgi:FdhD protein